MQKDGRLLHRYRNGDAGIKGHLPDYAFVCLGFIDLYEATLDVRWLREAKRLATEMQRLFRDPDAKGFLFSAKDDEGLLVNSKDLYDGAIPSGNSAATLALVRLGQLLTDRELVKAADDNLLFYSGRLDAQPEAFPFMLLALDFDVGPSKEVVLAGEVGDPGTLALRRAIYARFLPSVVWILHPTENAPGGIESLAPLIKEQRSVGGRATAYVCSGQTCSAPTTEVDKLAALLDARR